MKASRSPDNSVVELQLLGLKLDDRGLIPSEIYSLHHGSQTGIMATSCPTREVHVVFPWS